LNGYHESKGKKPHEGLFFLRKKSNAFCEGNPGVDFFGRMRPKRKPHEGKASEGWLITLSKKP